MQISNIPNLEQAKMNAEVKRHEGILKNNPNESDLKKLKDLAEDFESIFLEIVLKSMRDSVMKSELIDGGNGEEIFRGMLDAEYAKSMATQRSTGIADAIERQLSEFLGTQRTNVKTDAGLKAYQNANPVNKP